MDILSIIADMQKEKKNSGINPDYILYPDLQNRVQEELRIELNLLTKDGKIGVRKTINSKAIYVK